MWHYLREFEKRIPTALRLAGVNLILTAVSFLTGVITARALGPEGRGIFAAVTVWAILLGQLALWGTHQHLSRVAAQFPQRLREIYKTGFTLVAFLSSAAVALAWVGFSIFADRMVGISPEMVFLGLLIIPASAANAFQIMLELGQRNYGTYNFCRAAFGILFFGISSVLFVSGNSDVVSYLIAFAIASAIAPVAGGILIARSLPKHDAQQKSFSFFAVLSGSTGFALTTALQAAAIQGDKILLSALFPAAALGFFVVASSIAQIQHTVGEAMAQLFYSRLTSLKELAELDREWTARKLRQSLIVYVAVAAICTALLPPTVPFIYGTEYEASADLLYILLPAVFFQAASRPYDAIFRALGMPYFAGLILGVATIVMAIGTVLASFQQSVLGVALAVLVGYSAGLFTASLLGAMKLGLKPIACLLPKPGDFGEICRQLSAAVRTVK